MKRYVTALLGIGAAAALTLAMGAAAASRYGICREAAEHRLLRQRAAWTSPSSRGLPLDAGGLRRPESANNQINLQARTDTTSTRTGTRLARARSPDVLRYPTSAAIDSILTNNQCDAAVQGDLTGTRRSRTSSSRAASRPTCAQATWNGDEAESRR